MGSEKPHALAMRFSDEPLQFKTTRISPGQAEEMRVSRDAQGAELLSEYEPDKSPYLGHLPQAG
jgi:hypothetical protein